ncbi:hypothetical protein SESBI_11135 [Sesbania bispinosa]|nr:hypothetical protein SESBI_11135 [Sesbania bispinosa]
MREAAMELAACRGKGARKVRWRLERRVATSDDGAAAAHGGAHGGTVQREEDGRNNGGGFASGHRYRNDGLHGGKRDRVFAAGRWEAERRTVVRR